MKTLLSPAPGRLTVADLPDLHAASAEVVVRVEAATVNPVDVMAKDGALHDAGLIEGTDPIGLGWDLVGTVASLGDEVTGLRIGDRVAGVRTGFDPEVGGISEYVAIPAADVALVPDELATLDAAGIGMNALTAAQALDLAGPAEGRRLLVTGAAGALGGFVAELAAGAGWSVVGLARESDREFVEAIGATLVTELGGTATYDVVVDAAPLQPDEAAFAELLPHVTEAGGFVGVLSAYAAPALPGGGSSSTVSVHPDGARLGELLRLAASGGLTSRIAGTTSLADVDRAFDAVAAGGRGRWLVLP